MFGTAAAAATPFLGGLPGCRRALAAAGAGIGPVILILLWACLFARIDSSFVETAARLVRRHVRLRARHGTLPRACGHRADGSAALGLRSAAPAVRAIP
ncbi:MAG: hypothetical protein ACLSVD_19135 [Eggerthellaceae bacterium]